MRVISHERGWQIYWDGEAWRYLDTDEAANGMRRCRRCGCLPDEHGHDACVGTVPGARSVCCGHGVAKPILIMESAPTSRYLEDVSDDRISLQV